MCLSIWWGITGVGGAYVFCRDSYHQYLYADRPDGFGHLFLKVQSQPWPIRLPDCHCRDTTPVVNYEGGEGPKGSGGFGCFILKKMGTRADFFTDASLWERAEDFAKVA